MRIELEPIGYVTGGRAEPEDDHWGGERATIRLDDSRFTAGTLAGLDQFSHVDVVYFFHLVDPTSVTLTARHPRGRADWPEVGIFAQRAKGRPNRIGVTTCRLLAVDDVAVEVEVEGLDAIDGTPVLDIKPYMVEFGPRGDVRQPAWSSELMRDYW